MSTLTWTNPKTLRKRLRRPTNRRSRNPNRHPAGRSCSGRKNVGDHRRSIRGASEKTMIGIKEGFGYNVGSPVQNIPQTLRLLKQVDPELRKRVPDEIKSYAEPMLTEIKGGLPDKMLSGWSNKGRTGYRPRSAKYNTRLRFRGSRPRSAPYGAWPILRVESKHIALVIASMAGRKTGGKTTSGKAMISALRQRYGGADRFIWPYVVKHQPNIERGIRNSLERYETILNRELKKRR
jgi:hypothetical protein